LGMVRLLLPPTGLARAFLILQIFALGLFWAFESGSFKF